MTRPIATNDMTGDIITLLAQITNVGSKHEDVNISATDYTPTLQNCKVVSATAGNYIKVDYIDEDDATATAIVPIFSGWAPVRGVTKVYKVGTDPAAENITLWR